jgi:3alpha(or 20beta)-hydroxysteroid dehydrogenase
MGKLDGRVAIVTGGARGQGAAEAALFAQEGARVVITDLLDDAGAKTARECGGTYIHHDVSNESDWVKVVDAVMAQHGHIDILVNNAGIWRAGRLVDTVLADYERVIAVNQVGVFLGMKTVAPAMINAGKGAIVNISSIAGMQGSPGSIAYGASKWAVRGMTKSAAQELARFGIRVNSIHPGLIDTDMLHQIPAVDADAERWTRRVPLRRFAEAGEVAKLALFLVSDDSSYSTGSEFIIDGGYMA